MRYPLAYYLVFIPIPAAIILITIGGTILLGRQAAYGYNNPGPVYACQLYEDSTQPGKVYVRLNRDTCYGGPIYGIYETLDNGYSWQPSSMTEPNEIWYREVDSPIPGIYFDGFALWNNDKIVWESGRRIFRTFFYSNDYQDYGANYSGIVVANPPRIYVTMGTLGVLISPISATELTIPWQMSRLGLPIQPEHMPIIDHPLLVIVIVSLGLLVPPLTWIHTWLLAQVWRYTLMEDESDEARKLAFRISIHITGLAAVAIIIWLTNIHVDFFDIVGVMTLVTVGIGVFEAVQLGRKADLPNTSIVRLAAATGIASLIVPAGVAVTPNGGFGWPIIITLIVGFILYRRWLSNFAHNMSIRISRWQLDSLTLEWMTVFVVVLLLSGAMIAELEGSVGIVTVVGAPTIAFLTAALESVIRIKILAVRKKGKANEESDENFVFYKREWYLGLLWNTFAWFAVGLFISAITYCAQLGVYFWFTSFQTYYF